MSVDWFVVQTQPRLEEKAVANLRRQGFETYFPQYLKRRRHSRRVEMVRAPLFPRYLFVTADSALHKWRSIRSTFGVSALVSYGDRPASVSASIIEQLRSHELGGVVAMPNRIFKFGDAVRIVEGAFTGCLGLFEEMRDEERICVLLDLLGRKVRVVLDEGLVVAA